MILIEFIFPGIKQRSEPGFLLVVIIFVMECFFKDILKSCHSDKTLEQCVLSNVRILKIVSCSKERKDNIVSSIKNSDSGLHYHADCYREYISKEKIRRWLNKVKKKNETKNPPVIKHLRRYNIFY